MADYTGFRRIMIANRGEVAERVARTCERLGVTPVLAVSAADAGAPYTKGRETVALGPARAAHSYLNLERIVEAARQRRCTA
ncbi:MAG: biotin carboxylase N-terminal domain-containing protein, partial [Myxococcota bacterium]